MLNRRLSLLTFATIISMLLSLINTVPARADDGTPPTEVPVATEVPTEVPVATEVPVETAPVEPILAQVPEGTEVVVLGEDGQPESLATQAAGDAILAIDPMWCPAGKLPNESECTANMTIEELLLDMQTNPGNYSQDGVVYFDNTAPISSSFVLDDSSASLSSSYSLLNLYNLTLQGGWNGGSTSDFNGSTTFDGANAYVRIGSSANPWAGSVTLQDFIIQNVTSADNAPLEVNSTGTVTMNDVTVSGSGVDQNGIDINASNVDLTDVEASFSNANGIEITASEPGTVTLDNVTASYNQGSGVLVNGANTSVIVIDGTFAGNGRYGIDANDSISVTIEPANVWTDAGDYAPGSLVTFGGGSNSLNGTNLGYLPGETVRVKVEGLTNGYIEYCEGVANAYGGWSCQVTLWPDSSAVGDYTYTAEGLISHVSETGTFTDCHPALSLDKTTTSTGYSAIGDLISYSYKLTNTGDVILNGPFSVTDNKVTVACPPTPNHLHPNEVTTCSATYAITQADLNAGSVVNTARGKATYDGNTVNSNTDSVTVYGTQTKSLSLVKNAAPTTYSAVGDLINYSYILTNTGNVTLYDPFKVSDDHIGSPLGTAFDCGSADSLAPGASITCTKIYTIKSADLAAGSVTNKATGKAKDKASGGSYVYSNEATATVNRAIKALSLTKTADPLTYNAKDQTITYTYVIKNTGNVTLIGPFTVSDDHIGTPLGTAFTCGSGPLAPNATTTCTATYTITVADLAADFVTNTATASGDGITSPPATATVTYSSTPDKKVTICHDNSGSKDYVEIDVSINSVKSSDDWFFNGHGKDPNDIWPEFYARNGDLILESGNQDLLANHCVVVQALSLIKTATPGTYSAVGNVIGYSYLVTNSGNVTLAGPFTVSDDKATDESCPAAASLAPGASITCSASYTITQADLDSGSVTNIASATNGTVTSPTDTETVTAVKNPGLSIVKTATPGTYSAVGNVIGYSYLVTNSGNVTLAGPFTVSDDKATDESCPAAASLAPGASITCSASYTITQADLDSGSVTNIASATNGTVTSPTDTETVTAVKNPGLSIVKTATPGTYSAVGNVIGYSYLVTNSGNVTLSGPFTVSDDKATDESCPATASLAPGASITCSASYTITQADLDSGSVTNIASATNGTVTSPTDTETVTAVKRPGLSIVKTATPGTYSAVGNVIGYSYLVTNSGNVTLSGPFTVSDDKATDESCPATASLAPGASITCSASYTITQADLDSGSVTNIASATNGTVTSPTDTETVTAVKNPGLSIVKTATPGTYSAVGNVIGYSYLVTNSGNVTLTGPFTVSDDKATDESCPATASLAPGASITCSASYTITQADLDSGSVTNIASATNGTVTSPTDTETVTAVKNPGLSIVKTATPGTYSAVGNVIGYSYLVTNSGNVTLTGPFTVSDDKATDESCPAAASLAPGASITCSASYTITQADLDAGSVTNIASATNGTVTSPTDTETVTAVKRPGLSIVKTATPGTYSAVGNVIGYSYLVTNSGNVTLSGPFTVSDDKATDESCPATASLAPGASITCSASYTITQADLDSGSVTNIASATNGTVTSPTDTETVDAVQTKTLSLTKTADPLTYNAKNQTITYSYVIKNTGNVTLSGLFSVADDKATVSCTQPVDGALSPNETMDCTASYIITQADLDAGKVTNTATASGAGVTSNEVTATVNAIPDNPDEPDFPLIAGFQPIIPVTGLPIIVAGLGHTCMSADNGRVVCWGLNASGQVGNGTTVNQLVPVFVRNLSGVLALTAGSLHTCALNADGEVWCWGENGSGQLGNGSTVDSLVPVKVMGLPGKVIDFTAGEKFTCALLDNEEVWCWGENGLGQLNDGTTINRLSPVKTQLNKSLNVFSGGKFSLVGDADGNVENWIKANALAVQEVGSALSISANRWDTGGCAVTAAGIVRCWTNNLVSSIVGDSLPALLVGTGLAHGCALNTDQTVSCWGSNSNGELGDSTRIGRTHAGLVKDLAGVTALAAGSHHNCVLVGDGNAAMCWGDNTYGQLGNNTTTGSTVPVAVYPPTE